MYGEVFLDKTLDAIARLCKISVTFFNSGYLLLYIKEDMSR